jgi:hypothetical protein
MELNEETVKDLSYFFRTLPKQPYAYEYRTDGAAVGKYNPKTDYITPQVKQVTREKFLDMRDP